MKPVILPLVGVLLLTGACSGGDTAKPAPAVTAAPSPACPGGKTNLAWPAEVPATLPKPPGAVFKAVARRNGITSVRFSTPTSLREGLLFVLRELPRSGFTIGRGDAEPAEADVPFGRGNLQGIYKMIILGTCSTDWLVAVTQARRGGSPILTPNPGASSTPLPFG